MSKKVSPLLLSLLYGAAPFEHHNINEGLPKINESIINPPQSQESKQYYIKKAQEKRERKKLRRQG